MSTEHRIAVIGAGLVGTQHIERLTQSSRARLASITDPAQTAGKIAARRGVARFETVDEMLAKDRPDGVIIATPNDQHRSGARATIEAGIPTLIEKPIAQTAQAARDIVQAVQSSAVPVLIGHHRRHSPAINAAKTQIDAGAIGEITAIHMSCWLYKPDDYFSAAWRTRKGAGPVFINLIHDIDLLRHLGGEIESVQALTSNARRRHTVEDTATVIARLQSGALATLTISDTIPAPHSWELTAAENPAYPRTGQSAYHIGGTHGTLTLPDLKLWKNKDTRSWWEPMSATALPKSPGDPLIAQLDHFCDLIERKAEPIVTAQDGYNSLRAIEAIIQAAENGMSITLT
jgi:predicted dehydrogenase